MVGMAGMAFVAGLVSASLLSVSSSGQPYDEAVCFKGQGAERLEACSRLITSKDADEYTRGLAHASRCMEHVNFRKLEKAREDCDAAQRLAPEAPQTQFALYAVNFYRGTPRDAEIHLAKYRELVDAERERQAEMEKLQVEKERLRQEAIQVADLRHQCVTKSISRPTQDVIASCDALWDLSKTDLKDRALASAISCRMRTQLNQLDLAERDCTRSFQSAPSSAYGHFARASLRLVTSDFEGALADIKAAKAFASLPREETKLLDRYHSLATRGVVESARKKAEEQKLARETAREEQARLESLLRNQLKSDPNDPFEEADEWHICQSYQSAPLRERACLNRALRKNPYNHILLLRLGTTYAHTGDHLAGINKWSDLLSAAPSNNELLIARCRQRAIWGNELQLALKDCSDAIMGDPKNLVPLELRANIHLRLKNIKAALADYNAAMAVDPLCSDCLFVIELFKEGKLKDMIDDFYADEKPSPKK
jgi:tetratricopeptide (TPR) repeat protein